MGNMFKCALKQGGSSGSGADLIVTCSSDFAGLTITATKGATSHSQTCPSTSPYVVTFSGLDNGTWIVSGTIRGQTYSVQATITDFSAVLNSGFDWQGWVDSSVDLDSSDYQDLDEVLADEKAVRELMLVHASVDFLAASNVDSDVEKIINNDICAKWINLSDYALDTLYAVNDIKTVMDEADKYGYGEWVIVDDTTTPPTWGPKGNVPVMTSNTAPYGEASASNELSGYNAYKAFDKVNTSANSWFINTTGNNTLPSDTHIKYKFTNPVLAKKAFIRWYDDYPSGMTATIKIQGSNDTNTWNDVSEEITFSNGEAKEVELTSSEYYLYYKLLIVSQTGININYYYGGVNTLQFYGRQLSVSVPVMTSNTAPYGTASCSSHENSTEDAWGGFNPSSNWTAVHYEEPPQWLGYEFPHKVVIKMVTFGSYSNRATKLKIQASNNGFVSDIHDLSDELAVGQQQMTVTTLNNNIAYKSYRYYVTEKGSSGGGWTSLKGEFDQFYGLDYSEKEFETGTNKKWLYDHGVELEPMNTPYYDTMQQRGEYTKGDNDITLDALLVSGSSKFVGIATQPIDLTNCSKIFAIAEVISSDGNSSNEFNIAVVTVSGEITTKTIAFVDTYSQPQPYPAKALDVSAVNQSANIGITAYRNVKGKFTELWLEP